MSDLGAVLSLWREATAADEDYVLATVVAVEGSSYRKPGARMLLTASGRRAGGVSGGCLEAEVSRKAWWLTERGPTLQRYATFLDAEGEIPYGLGCGGTVEVLLERSATAAPMLEALARAWDARLPCSAATVIAGEGVGRRSISNHTPQEESLAPFAHEAALRQTSFNAAHDGATRIFAEYAPPRPGLFIFGAGDDAQPLLRFARTLDWYCAIADGRRDLAARERFPLADGVVTIAPAHLDALKILPTDAAVLMTHSYEQDGNLLRALLPRQLRYLGVLGPRRRTQRLVEELAPELDLDVEACMARLHSPVGLQLGAESPASIALSIAAEIEASLHGRSRNTGLALAPAAAEIVSACSRD